MAIVYKTLGAEALDQFYSGDPTQLKQAFQDGRTLMQAPRLSDAARQLEGQSKLPAGSGAEFEQYWAYAERVIRLGYEQAIILADSADPKAVETFFVAGAGPDFEVHISEGKYAVTVFIFVPGARAWGSERARSSSWVVRAGGLRELTSKTLDKEDPPVVKTRVSGRK